MTPFVDTDPILGKTMTEWKKVSCDALHSFKSLPD